MIESKCYLLPQSRTTSKSSLYCQLDIVYASSGNTVTPERREPRWLDKRHSDAYRTSTRLAGPEGRAVNENEEQYAGGDSVARLLSTMLEMSEAAFRASIAEQRRIAEATEQGVKAQAATLAWTQGIYQEQKRQADALERIAAALESGQ